ncbi:MAG: hypothetical protein E7105_03190 [Prevotella sp.]|nr:hypothetical protein [Prevotella sp.]
MSVAANKRARKGRNVPYDATKIEKYSELTKAFPRKSRKGTEICRKDSFKNEKAALKFGGIAENAFLCGVKTSVLNIRVESREGRTASPPPKYKGHFGGLSYL